MWQRGSGIDCDDVCQSQPPALHSITQWNSCSPYDMRPGHWTLNTGRLNDEWGDAVIAMPLCLM